MKRKIFLSSGKGIACLMVVIMLLSMITGVVFGEANDELQKEVTSGEITEVAPSEVEGIHNNDELEMFEDNSGTSLGDPSPTGNNFLNGLALVAGGFGTTGKYFLGTGYTCVYMNDGKKGSGRFADMNNNAGGKYIFLGYKYATSFYDGSGKLRSDLITGLLVYNGGNPPNQFKYKGKTYKPITNLMKDSNGDFNQDAGGSYLYLYYTNDGIAKGDSVLTWIRTKHPSNKTHSPGYVKRYTSDGTSDTPEHCLCQDMNENAGGDFIYLETEYHTHTLVDKKDATGHPYKACSKCDFHTEPEHNYLYSDSSEPGRHEVTCTYGKETFNEPHVDADGDKKCDKCSEALVAAADDLLFDTFREAWDYALAQDHQVDIKIRTKVDADKEGPLKPIDNGAKIRLTRADPYDVTALINTYSMQPFTVNNGFLTINTDIVDYNKNESLKSLISVGNGGILRIENAAIYIEGTKTDPDWAVISAEKSGAIYVKGGQIDIDEKNNNGTGIKISGSNCFLETSDLNIQGGGCAIKADQSPNVEIGSGTFNAKTCALMLTNGAKSKLTDGKFFGKECINAEGGSVSVNNIIVEGEFKTSSCLADCVPSGCSAFVLDDAGKPVEVLPYSIFEKKEYTFTKRTLLTQIIHQPEFENQTSEIDDDAQTGIIADNILFERCYELYQNDED